MQSIPFPISDARVVEAFPDLAVTEEPLGRGGMKNAYLAQLGGEKVVLKVIRQGLGDEESLDGVTLPDRMLREIAGMRVLDHPNIVRILDGPDVRVIDGERRGWYIEPHYPGGTLTSRLNSPWPEDKVLCLVRDLIQAVSVMALKGIVHRDIKPDNIVFDENDQPVLLDLGIALFVDATPLTHPMAQSPHTPRYAAPEQFDVRHSVSLDFRTDLFLVGIVGYETLTGEHPFCPDSGDYINNLVSGKVDLAKLADFGVTARTSEFVTRLLASPRNRRFRKIEHAVAALEACL